jgi:hypothetical protein
MTEPTTNVSFRARVQTPGGAGDSSFFVRVNDGPWQLWDTPLNQNGWSWGTVKNRGSNSPYSVNLDTGVHVLEFKLRQDGTRLDAVELQMSSTSTSTLTPISTIKRVLPVESIDRISVFSNERLGALDLFSKKLDPDNISVV